MAYASIQIVQSHACPVCRKTVAQIYDDYRKDSISLEWLKRHYCFCRDPFIKREEKAVEKEVVL